MEGVLAVLTAACVGIMAFELCGVRPVRLGGGAVVHVRRGLRVREELASRLEELGHRVPLIRLGNLPPVASFSSRLLPVLKEGGLEVTRRGCVAFAVCALAVFVLAGLLVSGSPLGAVVGLIAASSAAVALIGRRERRLRDEAAAQMPEVLRCLSSALGAGRSLPQAIEYAGSNLDEPMGSEFLRASFQIKSGVPIERAVGDMCKNSNAPGIELVGTALQISQRTGSPLCDLFERTAGMVSETVDLRRELQVKTSQARLSAKVVAGMPVVLACVLTLLSPDYRAGLAVPAGRACLCVAVLLDVVALGLLRRIMHGSTP